MSARAQCLVAFLIAASIDLVLYAGAVASILAAAVATGFVAWRRLR